MMDQVNDVDVIIVGLNACDFIKQCIESLHQAKWHDYRYGIIYVDNGSTDSTLSMLESGFPDVRVIANDHNLGYCKAANQGAEISKARYYCFINDDTIVLEDAIAIVVQYCDHHPDAGIVGSRLVYPDMTEQWSGRKFPTIMNAFLGRTTFLSRLFPNAAPVKDYLCKEQLKGEQPFEVDWVSAAGMTMPREVFHQVKGFAEDYYYWHEPIICDRVKRTGKDILLHPLSKIIHFEGKGSGSRPYPVQKFHILDFHRGAYRCYCEHFNLNWYHPVRWLVKAALGTRARILLARAWFTNHKGS